MFSIFGEQYKHDIMARILGLDLGTNSIGWAIVDKEGSEFSLADKGVIIFSAGVLKNEFGKYISKTSTRREFRAIRKLKFRLKVRKYRTLKVLIENKMCPLAIEDLEKWKKSNFSTYPTSTSFLDWLKTDSYGDKDNNEHKKIRQLQQDNPYYYRDLSVREINSKEKLGRVFYHLAQRRGFLSNRLDKTDDSVIDDFKTDIQNILDGDVKTIKQEIDKLFNEYQFENEKDLSPTGKSIKKIKDKILQVFDNKVGVNDSLEKNLETIKKEINGYLNRIKSLGPVKSGISNLDIKLKDGKFDTIGQYFYSIYNKEGKIETEGGKEIIVRNAKIRNQYTGREEHYIKEFDKICEVQEVKGFNKNELHTEARYEDLAKELYKAIFFQRPLKSQKGLVGYCKFKTNKRRCNISRPEFEEFRMNSYINNIKIKSPKDERLRRLNNEEIEKIKSLFFKTKSLTFKFSDIVERLVPEKGKGLYYKDKDAEATDYVFNYKLNSTVKGCPTIYYLQKILGENWKTYEIISDELNKKGNPIKYRYDDIWHIWETYTSKKKLESFAIDKLKLEPKKVKMFSNVPLQTGYCELSLVALNKINKYLEKGLIYSHAVFMSNLENVIKNEIWEVELNRERIEKEIGEIIDKYSIEKKYLTTVNKLLSKYYCEDLDGYRTQYSKEAEHIFKKDFQKQLENTFGKNGLEKNDNKEEDFHYYFSQFIEKLKLSKQVEIETLEKKIKEFLIKNKYCNEDALNKLYHPSDIEQFKSKPLKYFKEGVQTIHKDKNGKDLYGLGSPLTTSIKNPMAMKTIHQLRKLINHLLIEGAIDKKTIIHIETARELNDNNKRKAIEDFQEERKKLRDIYRNKIQELYFGENRKNIIVNEDDINKFEFALEQRSDGKFVTSTEVSNYNLWEEQNHICLYTGKTIKLTDFLGKNPQFDIEHTLPRYLSQDNSMQNKTLAKLEFNRSIKLQYLPSQLNNIDEIIPRIEHWKKRYLSLEKQIDKLRIESRRIIDENKKDENIQLRHKLKMEYDYWFGKYNRFLMEEITNGFKNSQLVDTGLITRFAQNYLKSCFEKIYSVKGTMTDEFRKLWAKDIFYKEIDGRLIKNRDFHTHHCKDAVVIACITKDKYDSLAKYWENEDKGKKEEAKKIIKEAIPWKYFVRDLKEIEETILVNHIKKDVAPQHTYKKLRKRGQILYKPEFEKSENGETRLDENGKKIKKTRVTEFGNMYIVSQKDEEGKPLPILQKSDSFRGTLHEQNFVGAIAKTELGTDNKPLRIDNKFILQKDEKGEVKKFYVKRKSLEKLNKTDIDNIVDENIKIIINRAIEAKTLILGKNGSKIEKNCIIWQNEQKRIPIKKVRVFVKDKPIVIKPQPAQNLQTEKANRKKHKHQIYAQNEENYCMAIYEGLNRNGKISRNKIIINNYDAGNYYKHGNKDKILYPIAPEKDKNLYTLKYILTKGKMVLIYDKSPNELKEMDETKCLERLFRITQLDNEKSAEIKLLHHSEAREKKVLREYMGLKSGMKGGKNLGEHKKYPWIKIGVNAFDCLVEDYDFEISPSGRIKFK